MKLIALLIGLVIERLATQIFHWRRMRWLDRMIDFGFRQAGRVANWPAVIPVILLGFVLVLPVFAVIWFLGSTLGGFTYLLLAVVVLFFSLGPRDIGEEVGEYCKALESGDEEQVHNAAKAIVEDDVPEEPSERTSCVEAAVCVQANNRLFAVVFWFVVLGPERKNRKKREVMIAALKKGDDVIQSDICSVRFVKLYGEHAFKE